LQAVINYKALHTKFTTSFFLLPLLLLCSKIIVAQQPTVAPPDTIRIIEIVKANSLRQKTIDSVNSIETAAGGVVIKEGLTTTYCDSVIIKHPSNVLEAFGNVHINDNDSIHTYAQYLKYIGIERIAYLKKGVKLTDKKGVLLTDDLEYNLRTGIAVYKGGGKVLNGNTVLTSKEGIYYADTKDVFFKKQVHLVDPKYNITTDSLKYNINLNQAEFITQTHIVSKDGIIDTKAGIYNLKNGEAIFYDDTFISDSAHSLSGKKIFSDEKTGIVQIDGNGKFVDSINQVTVIGGHLEISRKENSFLAYNKPVMVLHKDGDSTYITADTLFSGLRKYDTLTKKTIAKTDTLKKTQLININKKNRDSTLVNPDSLLNPITKAEDIVRTDTLLTNTIPNVNDTGIVVTKNKLVGKDSLSTQKKESNNPTKKVIAVNVNSKDTAIRYFLGFHHVRIFNDSLQAVSDSLYYSTEDSTFKLFGNPLVWNGKTQIAGDTVYMFTQNQKPKRLYVFNNGIIIHQTAEQLFDQIAGRTINGYFKEGSIDYIRVKGSPAESIFYPQDDDSAYVGMNRSSGDVIDIYFANKELNKVKFVNNVDGTMYPIRQIPPDKKQLKGFKWQDARRPKNKLELFE